MDAADQVAAVAAMVVFAEMLEVNV